MAENKKVRRRLGDRKDGTLVRDLDGQHLITPIIFPNRADNEAFISEKIDITNLEEYLKRKNEEAGYLKYSFFNVLVTASLKVLQQRPKMNRFIANKNLYQRNEISAAFVIKKDFADDAEEALAVIRAKETDNLDTITAEMQRQINEAKKGGKDQSTEVMDFFCKMPRFITKFIVGIVCALDKKGKVPQPLIETDPYYASVLFTQLGSIRLHAGYHHLANWGTNSFFVAVGEKKLRPFYNRDGSIEMRQSIDLGMTVDERIADGYYFSKSVRLLKRYLEHPEWLENELQEK